MRLSDAIRLGAMLRPQGFGSRFGLRAGACAIESAIEAIGGNPEVFFPDRYWPWLTKEIACPECGFAGSRSVTDVVAFCLNDHHRWTRERIADWIATVEPAEIPLDSSVTDATVSVPTEQPQEAAR